MAFITDIQKLEPGAEVRLFEIDGTEFGADIIRFHGHAIPHTSEELLSAEVAVADLPAKSIIWQGSEYAAWPVQIDGVGANGDGTSTNPKFTAGNVNGRITALCLAFEDLAMFKLTIHDTTATYLDAVNFPGGNPTADPSQEGVDVWYFGQKTGEDSERVEWDMASPGEVDPNEGLPGRQMTALCHWALTNGYRGPDCGYTGPYVDIDGNPTDNPELDDCSGLVNTGCKAHFGANNELSHGGFPAASLIARS
ncbi:phage minor tail protein L [Pseudomonas sp. NA-150]|uniref:phage minor tail protein L n=1 Tax=Pseudomonas sp. NA-150 TaxID=3367525 RepID=UPI0037CA0CFA